MTRKINYSSSIWIIILSIIGLSGCASDEKTMAPVYDDLRQLRTQIENTQKQLADLKQDFSKQMEQDLTPMKTTVENLQKTTADQKTNIDQVSGSIDNLNNRLNDYSDRMNKYDEKISATEQAVNKRMEISLKNLEDRINNIEQKVSSGSSYTASSSLQPSTNVAASLKDISDPGQLFKLADQEYSKGQYADSITILSDYRTRFPKGDQLASVLFLLGQSNYSIQNYDEALSNFNEFVNAYGTDDRIPAAMYKRALIYKKQNKLTDQQNELKAIVKKYPLASEAEQALEDLKNF